MRDLFARVFSRYFELCALKLKTNDVIRIKKCKSYDVIRFGRMLLSSNGLFFAKWGRVRASYMI